MRTTSAFLASTSLASLLLLTSSCGDSTPSAADKYKVPATNGAADANAGADVVKPKMITAEELKLGDIDRALADKGKTTYDVKCQACHSTGANRVVGPGWKGVTTRREPAWIMNMIMNTDAMLSADPEAQKLLEQCLVRMPNQNLSMDEARQVLEFMRTL